MMKVREGSTRGKLFCVKEGVEMVPAEEIELSVLTARIVRSVCAPRPLKQTRYLSSVRESMVAPVLNAYPEKQTRRVRRGQPRNSGAVEAATFWCSLTHLHADHFAADDDLHAPVLLPSGNGIVIGNRVSLAEPFGRDGVCR